MPAQPSLQVSRQWVLAWACALSLLGHAWLIQTPTRHATPAAGDALATHGVLHVRRLVTASPAATATPAATTGAVAAADEAPSHVSEAPMQANANVRGATQQTNRIDDGLDEYLPRRALTIGPVPEQPVFVPYPEGVASGDWRAIFTLFIDAQGQVQHVRLGGDELPAPLEAAARQAFLAASFKPGQLDGQPVKARVRVEVEFTTETRRKPSS